MAQKQKYRPKNFTIHMETQNSSSLLKENFTEFRILCWCFFPLNTLNISLNILLACMVSREKPNVFSSFAPLYVKCFSLLTSFRFFFFISSFLKFEYDMMPRWILQWGRWVRAFTLLDVL